MKPAPFAYLSAETPEDAVAALVEYGDDATVLAGGQSLVPMINMRLARPAVLVDVNGLRELDAIELDGVLTIGALTRQAAVERSPEVAANAPLLTEAMRYVGHAGDTQPRDGRRQRGARATAPSELPAVLVALGAELVALGEAGDARDRRRRLLRRRTTPPRWTASCSPTCASRACPPHQRTAFIEVARRHGDFALVGVAASLELDEAGACRGARIALSGVGGAPVRAREAEALLAGADRRRRAARRRSSNRCGRRSSRRRTCTRPPGTGGGSRERSSGAAVARAAGVSTP